MNRNFFRDLAIVSGIKERDMTRLCRVCKGKAYLVSTRDDGRRAVERCDACADGVLSDEQAAILARYDGINCAEGYPCYIKD